MNATGIIRRIDDLGRVVIPREIRRSLAIKDGDPLEIFYDTHGVTFKPYRPAIPNGDRIRAMNNEELAQFLSKWGERSLAWHSEYGETLAFLEEET